MGRPSAVKFLCEQCKAKYQIADDKVAGKTVRMKCRKCGHMIEVRAEVTETSVAKGLPDESKKGPVKPAAGVRPGGLATSLTGRAAPAKGKPDALTGAFQKKVRQEPESTTSLEMLDSAAAGGWYVAINGVPVGPVRVSELRRKAANGAVTEDSLVWRDGLEEWRPVRAVTELAEMVREAISSGRPSLVTPPPPGTDARTSAPPPAPSPGGMSPRPPQARTDHRAPSAPRAPEAPKAAPLAARSNVVPFTGRLATAEKRDEAEDIDVDEELEPVSASAAAAPVAKAAPERPVPTPAPAAAALPERPSLVTADPFALPPPATGTPSPLGAPTPAPGLAASAPLNFSPAAPAVAPFMAAPDVAPVAPVPGRPPNWLGIMLALMGVGFGVTAAIFLFNKPAPAPQPTVIVQPFPVPNGQTQPTATPTAAATDSAPPVATADKASPKPGAVAAKPATTPSANPNKANPLGLDGLVGGSGPSVGGGASAAKGSGSITTDQIEQTVRNYSLGVRRTCWERSGVQTPSVNINAKVTVVSSGQVSNVEATGNDPVVAKCIEGQVKSWHFPASGETTTVNIPFKFVRQ